MMRNVISEKAAVKPQIDKNKLRSRDPNEVDDMARDILIYIGKGGSFKSQYSSEKIIETLDKLIGISTKRLPKKANRLGRWVFAVKVGDNYKSENYMTIYGALKASGMVLSECRVVDDHARVALVGYTRNRKPALLAYFG